jgi:hypothetical protein
MPQPPVRVRVAQRRELSLPQPAEREVGQAPPQRLHGGECETNAPVKPTGWKRRFDGLSALSTGPRGHTGLLKVATVLCARTRPQ